MKRFFGLTILCFLILSACASSQANLPAQASASVTASLPPTLPPTQTILPPTPTITPTPTPVPPAQQGTPFFMPAEVISPDNAAQVTALASWGNGTLNDMALSPDGKTLAVASSIGVALYASDTIELRSSLHTDESVNELAYYPDGQTLVLGLSTRIILWNLPDDTTTLFDLSEIENIYKIDSLATSPDGKWLAIGTEGRTYAFATADNFEGGTYVFETTTGQLSVFLQDPQGTNVRAAGVLFSPDSQLLATAQSGDSNGARTILFWDTSTWQLQNRFDGEADIKGSAGLSFSRDGKTLAFPSTWTYLWLWNLADGTAVKPYAETDGYYFNVVAISPDGHNLAAGGYYGLLTLWDTTTGKTLRILQKRDLPIKSLIFSPDGQSLYAGSVDGIRVWDTASGLLIKSAINHTSYGKIISISPDGKRLATLLGHEIIIWDAASGTRLQAFAGYGYAAISPDWSLLATVKVGDQVLLLYNLASGKVVHSMDRGERQAVHDMFFSPDGRVLAQVQYGDDGGLLLWDSASGNLLNFLPDAYSFLAFTPDGKTFAAAHVEIVQPSAADNLPAGMVYRYLYVAFWDVASGTMGESFLVGGGDDNLEALVFSPDGTNIAVQIYHTPGGNLISLWSRAVADSIWTSRWTFESDSLGCPLECPMSFSPNGTLAVLSSNGNRSITVLDAANGNSLATLEGHNLNSKALADYTYLMGGQIFSPDGKQLISSGEDGLLFIWGVRP